MRRFLALTMAGVMLLSNTVFGATNIFYNDTLVNYTDQAPIIINERTYVPIRDVFETMGFEVSWEASTKLVGLKNDYYYVYINTNNSGMYVLNKGMEMKCFKLADQVKLVNGRTMLPLREILETMDYGIAWDASTKSSYVNDANDYGTLDAKYANIEAIMNDLSYEYEIDKSKEAGSFTEEEIAYISTISSIMSEAFKDVDDINSAAMTEIAKEVLALSCPDSLGSFGEEFMAGVAGCGESVVNYINAMEIMADGEEENLKMAGISFGMLMAMAAECMMELKPALDTLYYIAQERNIPCEEVAAILSGNTDEDEEIVPAEGVEAEIIEDVE